MEGKEQRFGIAGSALFDVVTTVTSCGAVNSALESFTGIGGAVPFANLSASEVIFGGVGTGLYSILLYVLLAVFIGGLMVGRTPEWLGKKLEAREIKLAGLAILITPLAALLCTASGVATKAGRSSIAEVATSKAGGHTPQGFSETFYAYLSQANNNGSAFAGYTGFIQPNAGNAGSHGITLADLLGAFDMLVARYAPILFALAVAGALAGKRVTPGGPGHDAHRQPDLRGAADRRDRPRRRADVLPRPAARSDRAGPDGTPLLGHASRHRHLVDRDPRVDVAARDRLPAGDHRRVAGGLPRQRQRATGEDEGKLIGSKIIGQSFARPVIDKNGKPKEEEGELVTEPVPAYFQSRPSATEGGAYNAAASTFSNRGPNSTRTAEADAENIKAYLALNTAPGGRSTTAR